MLMWCFIVLCLCNDYSCVLWCYDVMLSAYVLVISVAIVIALLSLNCLLAPL